MSDPNKLFEELIPAITAFCRKVRSLSRGGELGNEEAKALKGVCLRSFPSLTKGFEDLPDVIFLSEGQAYPFPDDGRYVLSDLYHGIAQRLRIHDSSHEFDDSYLPDAYCHSR